MHQIQEEKDNTLFNIELKLVSFLQLRIVHIVQED